MGVIDLLNWRYATKSYNNKKITDKELNQIIEAARLTATSSGLQPFEVIAVSSLEVREKIRKISWDQRQVTECSDLLVFAAWDNYTPERINMMFDLTNEVRGFTNEGWENYRKMILSTYPNRDVQVNFDHAAKQSYIALGTTMLAAAELGIDATPMEGFDANALDEILNLKQKGLRSVTMLPLGYREEKNDWLVNLKKVRKPLEKFVTYIK